MIYEFIIAGFGGQGVMLLGQLLCYAGMAEDKQVSWIPSYGPEMRGGTANCGVVISDGEAGSPVVTEPTVVVSMNRPSMEKFEPVISKGGLLVYNTSLIHTSPSRSDIRTVGVPANDIANDLGEGKVANMVVLGAVLQATGVVSVESVEKALKKILPPHRHHLLPLNMEAIKRGWAIAEQS